MHYENLHLLLIKYEESVKGLKQLAGVPNLRYMYICLPEGVQLRLAMEGKNIFSKYLYICQCEYYFQKSFCAYC